MNQDFSTFDTIEKIRRRTFEVFDAGGNDTGLSRFVDFALIVMNVISMPCSASYVI